MFLECDVLIPGGHRERDHFGNADRLRCKILCEGANGPTTPLADEILAEKKIFVIPDILANAGGVTVSYFEWVQDRQGFFWNEALVNERLEEIMVNSFDAVVDYAEKHDVNNRTAAYMLALDRVASRHPAAGNLRVSGGCADAVHAADAAVQRHQGAGAQRAADVPAGRFLRAVLRRRRDGRARTRDHADGAQ